jgi:hypothetical protein
MKNAKVIGLTVGLASLVGCATPQPRDFIRVKFSRDTPEGHVIYCASIKDQDRTTRTLVDVDKDGYLDRVIIDAVEGRTVILRDTGKQDITATNYGQEYLEALHTLTNPKIIDHHYWSTADSLLSDYLHR